MAIHNENLWFKGLDGVDVASCGLPVEKIYIIHSENNPHQPTGVEILEYMQPEPWAQIVVTNATTYEALAAHSGVFASRSEARKNGFEGPLHHGVEYAGTKQRGFWFWMSFRADAPTPTMSAKRLQTKQYRRFFVDMQEHCNVSR